MSSSRTLYPREPIVGICIATSGVYNDGEETHYRVVALPVSPGWVRANFSMSLRSHSFGGERTLTMDLDALCAGIEDELRFGFDNHYKLQG